MFCPVCKAEYRSGFTHCSDCDVGLVETLAGVTNPTSLRDDPSAALLWTGTDPVAEGLISKALHEAEIPCHKRESNVGALFNLEPVFAIFVHGRDFDAARAVLDSLRLAQDSNRRAAEQALEDEREEADAEDEIPLPESSADDDGSEAPDNIVSKFNPEDATAEVWSGEQTEMAEMLPACLRENGIGCVVDESGGGTRIRVVPDSEARAREIIREVVEGTPPE